jgi:hypothetical protein
MTDDTWTRLETFARAELGRPLFGGRLELKPETRLEQDLGLTGTDAVEFIDNWAQTFKIEVESFPYSRYFGPEGQELLSSLLGLFSKGARRPPRISLTLGMLANAMRAGRWHTETVETAARNEAR